VNAKGLSSRQKHAWNFAIRTIRKVSALTAQASLLKGGHIKGARARIGAWNEGVWAEHENLCACLFVFSGMHSLREADDDAF